MARSRRAPARQHSSGRTPLWAIILVIAITFLIAAAQFTLKIGLNKRSLLLCALGIALIGVAGLLLTYAFKHGDLSALHALLGLGFVWSAVAGVLLLDEKISTFHAVGITFVIIGVILISHRRKA